MIQNNLFKTIIYTITFILVIFIFSPIFLVVIKGLPNLALLIRDDEVIFAIKLSLYTTLISTILCLIFAIPVSYLLARYDFPFKKIVLAIIQVPLSLPPIASGVALLIFFSTSFIGNVTSTINIDPVFTKQGIIIANLFVNVPYTIRIIKNTIDSVDSRYEFICRTLGYNEFKTFIKVTLPLSKNGIMSGFIITFASGLGEFGTALMLAGATRLKTETLPVALFLNISCGDLDKSLAVAVILIIISLICILSFELINNKKVKI